MSGFKFYVAGAGSWRSLFPDESAFALYRRVYASGLKANSLTASERALIDRWQSVNFVLVDNGSITPQIPIFGDSDLAVLFTWFSEAARDSVMALRPLLPRYRASRRIWQRMAAQMRITF